MIRVRSNDGRLASSFRSDVSNVVVRSTFMGECHDVRNDGEFCSRMETVFGARSLEDVRHRRPDEAVSVPHIISKFLMYVLLVVRAVLK